MAEEGFVDLVANKDFFKRASDGFRLGSSTAKFLRLADEHGVDEPSFLDGWHTYDSNIPLYSVESTQLLSVAFAIIAPVLLAAVAKCWGFDWRLVSA